jgi:hypothetical protein
VGIKRLGAGVYMPARHPGLSRAPRDPRTPARTSTAWAFNTAPMFATCLASGIISGPRDY